MLRWQIRHLRSSCLFFFFPPTLKISGHCLCDKRSDCWNQYSRWKHFGCNHTRRSQYIHDTRFRARFSTCCFDKKLMRAEVRRIKPEEKSFFKQKCETRAGSSFLYVKFCLFSSSFMTVNKESFCFFDRWLDKRSSKKLIWALGKLRCAFFTLFHSPQSIILYRYLSNLLIINLISEL